MGRKRRQERPPLEVSNTSFHSGSQVASAATTKAGKEMMTTSVKEHSRVFGHEKPWTPHDGDRATQRRAYKHALDGTRADSANSPSSVSEIVPSESGGEDDETVEETYRNQFVDRALDGCNFFEEMIDVDREAGFGEGEDFDGQEDCTEGRPSDGEELSVPERYRQPRFSSDEDSETNPTTLELSLGRRYGDHYKGNATEATGQKEEGHFQDKGNNASMHQIVIDHMWLTLGSSNEEERLAPSHRDFWEEEKLKVKLEEEILLWKKKARRMKHRTRGPHTNNVLAVRKNSEHLDHVMRDVLAELRLEEEDVVSEVEEAVGSKDLRPSSILAETNGNSYKLMFMAFEELLREVEVTANKNRKKLDDVLRAKEEEAELLQQERRTWFETENQLRGRLSSLEVQHSRMSDMLRETAAALTIEKERRKGSRCELDRVSEMLVKEKKLHDETAEKFNTCENSFIKLRENLASLKLAPENGGSLYLESVETVLNDMVRELQCNFDHMTHSSEKTIQSGCGLLDIDELNRVKQQRNAAEAERDQIEERLSTLLRETRDGHGEMEALWLEREKLLEQKVGCLEAELHYLQSKTQRKEAEVMIERQRWADELEKCMQAWTRERNAWEVKLKERTEDRAWWEAAIDDCDIRGYARNDVAGGWNERERGGKMVRLSTRRRETAELVHDSTQLGSCDKKILDVGNLCLGTEEVVDDQKRMEVQRGKTEQWRRLAEYQQERKEAEKKLSAALILVTKLEQDIKANEVQMEEEGNLMEVRLANKSAEVENLKQSLKSKERDLEVTIQKFTDELKLIDKEVERERKEREQVMELHFASKRQLVCDIKAKEESWEKVLEVRTNELQLMEDQVKMKEKVVEELQRQVEEEKTLRERTALELQKEKTELRKELEETLADIWKVCEDERVQQGVAKNLLPGGDLSLRRPMWESLWLEYCRSREISDAAKVSASTVKWEFARGKVARFEKQITEAMSAIKKLRDEVKTKEEQILRVKTDQDREWEQREEVWEQERKRLLHLVDSLQQKEVQLNEDRQSREQEYTKNMEAMEDIRKLEQEEAAATISTLRGSTRELEWCLKRTNSLSPKRMNFPGQSSPLRESISHSFEKGNELVQVHASYLEELDRYIFDLESRNEAGERNSRNSKTAMEGEGLESCKEECDRNNTVMQIENELPTTSESDVDFNSMLGLDDDGRLSPRVSREWNSSLGGPGAPTARHSRRRSMRPLERGMCLTLNGLHTLTQEYSWTGETEGNLPIWQPERYGPKRLGVSGSFNGRSNSWMSDEMQSYPASPSNRAFIAMPAPSTATRRPQKWLVDISWLEQVRKEHAWLRQQLEIERQRVSALGRVEADNRWIEAAIIRALELKRQSDTKVVEMQRKLAAMQTSFATKKRGTSNP